MFSLLSDHELIFFLPILEFILTFYLIIYIQMMQIFLGINQ